MGAYPDVETRSSWQGSNGRNSASDFLRSGVAPQFLLLFLIFAACEFLLRGVFFE
jgi:hypothetical protein